MYAVTNTIDCRLRVADRPRQLQRSANDGTPRMDANNTSELRYMSEHRVPKLVEAFLGAVVPARHPRPAERLSELTFFAPVGAAAPTAPAAPTSPRAEPPIANLDTLAFDVFSYDAQSDALIECVVRIFTHHNIPAAFDVSPAALAQWAREVRGNYHAEVPFHNFRHAFNVFQTLHALLAAPGAAAATGFTAMETFAMLFAALCHDLQHPGVSNDFLAKTAAPLAVRYNDAAVLEQHHCATAFALVLDAGKSKSNVLAALIGDGSYAQGGRFREFRALVTTCILGTEVASHARHVKALEEVVAAGYDAADAAHRARLMTALVEAADISNEARAFHFSRQWGPLVSQEFCAQGDRERALGLPVLPMRDREAAVLAKEQQGFITFLCLPLFQQVAKVVPGVEECVANLRSNRDTWAAMRAE
jgi:hypothetical protein